MPFETREQEKKEKVKQSSVKHAFSFLFSLKTAFFFSSKERSSPQELRNKR